MPPTKISTKIVIQKKKRVKPENEQGEGDNELEHEEDTIEEKYEKKINFK